MDIDKFGPPEIRGIDTDFDIYFRLNKSEADTISSPATQAAIAAALTAAGGPYGTAAAGLISGYFAQIAAHVGSNGCSVKLTVRNGLQMKEFIAEPI
ncbi:hypothetical protein SB778_32335 [Paraburkholderia sp. SIMBA_050]